MTRIALIRSKFLPYHATARTNNKEWFKVPISRVFEIFTHWINWSHLIHGSRTHHFTLMNNHFHWILSTPGKDIGFVMKLVLTQVSLEINEITSRQNHVFGARYRWSIMSNSTQFLHVTKYGYRNPVVAGICEDILEYPYSTLSFHWGMAPSRIWCWRHPFEPEGFITSEEGLEWLNQPTAREEYKQTQRALNRKIFRYSWVNGKKMYIPTRVPGG